MRQIVFDTETTGFDPNEGHRVVEIGCVEMVSGAITGETFHRFINPQRSMPKGAYEVHGLSSEFLSDKPVFNDPNVGQAFLDFIQDAELIAHNASFDMRFMSYEVDRAGLGSIGNKVTDTLLLARKKFPGSPNSLDALCKRFNISLTTREKHGALIDSELLAAVYVELTGGAQAGLDFSMAAQSEANGGAAVGGLRKRKPRPNALNSLVTEQEHAAHAAFVEELGENAVWTRLSAS
ncbi:MAG: DNA polymerase III subunit epsilon [Pseudomonadota bacterium]